MRCGHEGVHSRGRCRAFRYSAHVYIMVAAWRNALQLKPAMWRLVRCGTATAPSGHEMDQAASEALLIHPAAEQ